MNKTDTLIDAAIAAEEEALLRSLAEEPHYMRQLLALFSGRTGWMNLVIMVVQTLAFIASVWAAWHFFQANEVLLALKWGLSAAVLLLMSLMLKLSLWPVVHINRLVGEVRRLEQVLLSSPPK